MAYKGKGTKIQTEARVCRVIRFVSVCLLSSVYANFAYAGDGDVYFDKGRVALRHGDSGTAERSFQRTLYKEPAHRQAMQSLVDLYIAQHRYEDAMAIMNRWQEQMGEDGRLWTRKAFIYDLTGRQQEATRAYATALDLAPEDPEVLAHAAGHYYAIGDRARAEGLSEMHKRVTQGATAQSPRRQ